MLVGFLFGGVSLCVAYPEHWPYLAIYSLVVMLLLALAFADSWPFEKLGVARIVVQQYWVNAAVCLALAVYPCFALPTLFAGICLALAAAMFAAAAATGEKGKTLQELRTAAGAAA